MITTCHRFVFWGLLKIARLVLYFCLTNDDIHIHDDLSLIVWVIRTGSQLVANSRGAIQMRWLNWIEEVEAELLFLFINYRRCLTMRGNDRQALLPLSLLPWQIAQLLTSSGSLSTDDSSWLGWDLPLTSQAGACCRIETVAVFRVRHTQKESLSSNVSAIILYISYLHVYYTAQSHRQPGSDWFCWLAPVLVMGEWDGTTPHSINVVTPRTHCCNSLQPM